MRPLRLFPLATLLALLLPAAVSAQAADVRVRLFGTAAPASVTVTGAATVTMDGAPVGRTRAGGTLTVLRDADEVEVSGGGFAAEGRRVEITPEAGTLHVVAGRQTVDVAGSVTGLVWGGALAVVNRVPMPDYVASVVASEYGFPEIEGVKAQAVLARTYAARAATVQRPFDVDDHQGSQVYRGAGVVTETARRAERETRGQILTYGGAPVEALYSSSSGGHTADNEAVWGTAPVPYLRGVPDPYDDAAPDHAWRTTADAARLASVLARRYGGAVTGVEVAERSREGRAVRVRLLGTPTVISGADFRTVVNGSLGWRTVRSTLFAVTTEGGQVVFTGGGFGHGVGMSQYGARGQARAGRTYRDILGFYFAGTAISGGDAPVLLASDQTRPALPRSAQQAPWPPAQTDARGAPRAPRTSAPSAPRASSPSAPSASPWPTPRASPPVPPRASLTSAASPI